VNTYGSFYLKVGEFDYGSLDLKVGKYGSLDLKLTDFGHIRYKLQTGCELLTGKIEEGEGAGESHTV
jgi:hypothetical protein